MEDLKKELQQAGDMENIPYKNPEAVEIFIRSAIAKKFPRDWDNVKSKAIQECSKRAVYENALYSLPRQNKTVTGPTIGFMRMLQTCAGNIQTKVSMTRKKRSTLCKVTCVDLETNLVESREFEQEHVRDLRQGKTRELTSQQDIYELSQSRASKMTRACLESMIPVWLKEEALQECERMMTMDQKNEQVDNLIKAFEGQGVERDKIEAIVGKHVDALESKDIVHLRKVYNSIKNGEGRIDEFLPKKSQQKPPMEEAKIPTETQKKEDKTFTTEDIPWED